MVQVNGSATSRSGTGGSPVIDSPSGVALGEWLVVVQRINSSAADVSYSNLQGFTILHEFDAQAGATIVLGKVADSADVALGGTASAYTFAYNVTDAYLNHCFRVGGAGDLPDEFSTASTYTSQSAFTLAEVPAGAAERLALWFANCNTLVTFGFSAGTEIMDNQAGTNRTLATASEGITGSATGTRTATPSATATGHGGSVAIAAAAGGGGPEPGDPNLLVVGVARW